MCEYITSYPKLSQLQKSHLAAYRYALDGTKKRSHFPFTLKVLSGVRLHISSQEPFSDILGLDSIESTLND